MSATKNAQPVSLCIGPSHAVRWNWHVRDGVVPSSLPFDRFLGGGGVPIWAKRHFERARATVDAGRRVGLMVGDFRFGNSVLRDPGDGAVLRDGHALIDKSLLSDDANRQMLEHGVAALRLWHETFGSAVRYVMWDLFCRQVMDRLDGKYLGGGTYSHPIFDHDRVVAAVPGLDLVDLKPLLRLPMHEVSRLFLDRSGHPTQIGYQFLELALVQGLDTLTAYDRAVAAVSDDLQRRARDLVAAAGAPVLLSGRSVWLDGFVQGLGANGADRLQEAGLIVAPLERAKGRPHARAAARHLQARDCLPVVLSAEGCDLAGELKQVFGQHPLNWRHVPVLDWEGATAPAICERGETPRFAHARKDRRTAASVVRIKVAPHMVEQGPSGCPSWAGILAVLDHFTDAIRAPHGVSRLAEPAG